MFQSTITLQINGFVVDNLNSIYRCVGTVKKFKLVLKYDLNSFDDKTNFNYFINNQNKI